MKSGNGDYVARDVSHVINGEDFVVLICKEAGPIDADTDDVQDLRELVADMYDTMCRRDEEYDFDVLNMESFAYSSRIRSLGIDVG